MSYAISKACVLPARALQLLKHMNRWACCLPKQLGRYDTNDELEDVMATLEVK